MASSQKENISIVLAVLNGAEELEDSLRSIHNAVYPKSNIEIIAVNDGSTDNTLEVLKKHQKLFEKEGIKMRIINFEENQGRIKARLAGAKAANYERIMIMDHQIEMDPDALEKASAYSDTSFISNLYMNKHRSNEDRLMYVMRKKFYKPYWGVDFKNVTITDENFSKIPKGTGSFFTYADLFIKYSLEIESMSDKPKGYVENVENEDTLLFRKYIENGEKLMRVSDVKFLYKTRTGFGSFHHIFKRGPRFVSYYIKGGHLSEFLKKGNLLSIGLILAVLGGLVFFLLALGNPVLFLFGLVFLLGIDFLLGLYFSEEILDFFTVIVYLPIVTISFILGVLEGIRVHYFVKR